MSRQFTKTLVFAAVAAACVIGAVVTNAVTKPAKLDDAVLVGDPFYPDFTDPLEATALRVAAYDTDAAETRIFNVESKDGQWRIPSHHFYPADGEEQLANTAASVVGIERGSYAGKTAADHKRLGVLDPLDASIAGTEGRGDRVTLYKGDATLVDYIIGDAVEDAEGVHYVRRADEQKVYRARMASLSVSTKFADWIEQDLLGLDRNKLVEMVVDRYHIDEQRGAVVPEEVNKLTKVDNKWTLEGLDPETEELQTGKVSSMTFALGDLKIVGVRPKPRGLSAQLRQEEGGGLNQLEVLEMQQRGFFITPNGELLSNEGEILAATNEGVRYALRFGEVFTGSEVEIEAGSGGNDKAEAAESGDDAASEGDDADTSEEDADADTSLDKSRYVFITVSFDESLLGEAPVEPVKPTEPGATPEPAEPGDAGESDAAPNDAAGDAPASASDSPASDDAAGDDKPTADDAPADDPAAADDATTDDVPQSAADDAAPADGDDPAAEPADPQEEYKKAQAAYAAAQAAYEIEKAAYDKKLEAGRERVKELNDRFADWYYVISAKLFDDLHVSRADLVKAKEPAATDDAGTTPIIPGITTPETTTPETSTPDGDTPPTNNDNPAPSDAPDSPKPADPPATDDAKPDDAPDTTPKPDEPETESPASDKPTDEGDSPEPPDETP